MSSSLRPSSSRGLSQEQEASVIAELTAIVESSSFSNSRRCRDFLDFVVRHALAGDYEGLTERFLGVQLFGRAVDYETATDSIVRVRANDVRRRLAQYYAGRQINPPVKIDLGVGGYIPEFHWRSEDQGSSPKMEENAGLIKETLTTIAAGERPASVYDKEHLQAGRHPLTLWWVGAAAIAIVAAAACLLLIHPRPSNLDQFWQPILKASAPPVLCLPTTDTFQLEPNAVRAFSQLKPGSKMTIQDGDIQSFHNWHVSMPVMQAALSVALVLERMGKTPLVRIGTDLKEDELRGHPVIAIGSFSNPWTEQNITGLRFTFDRGLSDRDPPRIRDTQNPNRSWSLPHIYPEPQTKDYAIVTRTFDPVTHEPFLSLAGLHSFGNQIAGEFISQGSSWDEIAARAPAGWEKMNMQILLETNIVDTTPSPPKIVDVYFWK